jgi:hypothetical protein
MANENSSLPLNNPFPDIVPPQLSLVGGTDSEPESPVETIKVEHEDGSITIDFKEPEDESQKPEDTDFGKNLALDMDEDELNEIASTLLDGIKQDDDSRKDWLDTRTMGISLLGLKLEKPRSDAGTSSAPLEGMSTVRHPILLEATVSFQATARAELLPAAGPVKVRNDAPMPPKEQAATQALAETMENKDDLSQALEKDMNHYLTTIATEYVPDTDRMLFYIGFGGDGFKKVYNCPLRRRPVSESIDAENLIISNAATDMQNSGRVTHVIKMRKSILRRMQILEVYRDVELSPPAPVQPTSVDKKLEDISGVKSSNRKAEDREYEIYECYCELDLDQFAPKKFKKKGLPLPYRVTLEKDSHQVLDIRRNWEEKDEQCLAKRFFVQFPFVRGLGFYGLGYIHLLGNTANALTAAWRLMLDAGMFSNFPGFIYAKGAGRQLTNQFRVPPGGGIGLDTGSQASIKDAIMPLPYKEVGPSFTAFTQHVEEVGRRLASTAQANVGEGKQDAPVGTTLALIEQASKILDSAHKRLHAAQAEEFKLLKERFREDPEAFWRHNKKPTIQWKKEQFVAALNNCELVPVADPNNPTALHRYAKGQIIKELQKASPLLYDPIGVDMKVLRIADINPEGLFKPKPDPAPPDPRMEAIKEKASAQDRQSKIQLLETQIKAATSGAAIQDRAKDRESRERIEQMKIQLELLKIEEEKIIHQNEGFVEAQKTAHELQLKSQIQAHQAAIDAASKHQEMQHADASKVQELAHDHIQRQHELRGGRIESQHEIDREHEKHTAQMERDRQKHEMEMEHAKEMHAAKLEAARALARVKKPAKKGTS